MCRGRSSDDGGFPILLRLLMRSRTVRLHNRGDKRLSTRAIYGDSVIRCVLSMHGDAATAIQPRVATPANTCGSNVRDQKAHSRYYRGAGGEPGEGSRRVTFAFLLAKV